MKDFIQELNDLPVSRVMRSEIFKRYLIEEKGKGTPIEDALRIAADKAAAELGVML